MKWILFFSFAALTSMAEMVLSDLPADVQNDIKITENSQSTVKSEKSEKLEAKIESKTDSKAESKPLMVAEEKSSMNVAKASAKENEIPLSLEATKKAAASESTYFRIMLVIAMLGILACGTWVFVRKNKFQNIKRNKNEIKILAQHYMGPKRSIAVVRVAGESILVGITDTQINMIKTLSLMDDEFPEVTNQNFKSELDVRMEQDFTQESKQPSTSSSNHSTAKGTSTVYNRKSQMAVKANRMEDDADEFSIRGIKDLVSSKLKNMRSI